MITATSKTGGRNVAALANRLHNVASRAIDEEPKAVAPALARMLDAYYNSRQSPNGQAWAKRVSGGSWPLLEKTGAMRRSRTIETGRGFLTIGYEHPSEHHQRGTSRMVARKLLPEGQLSRPISIAIGTARSEWWRWALGVS